MGQELNSQAEKDDIQADTCDDVVSRISATASKIQTLRFVQSIQHKLICDFFGVGAVLRLYESVKKRPR